MAGQVLLGTETEDRERARALGIVDELTEPGEQLLLIDGVTIAPGDLVCGDEDGVVVVPADRAPEVAALAAEIEAAEDRIVSAVRDCDEMRDRRFPVFSRNNTVRGTRKLFPGALGVDIRLGGVPVSTGDLVVGDADGLVVLPATRVPDVLDRADARVAQEATILDQLRAGATTLELYGLDPKGQS